MVEPYRAYVSDSSYFSGKLEAYLRYKGIAHERIEINSRILLETILPGTGAMKVPAMQCADGRWLKDTTPMIAWLDREHPAFPVYPKDPAARFIARLVEEYADDWLWRPAMYYRWRFADSHQLRRRRLGAELSAGTLYSSTLLGWFMRWRQYLIFVRGDGVRAHNEPQVQALYHRTLAQFGTLLRTRRFLLGARPSIVDFAFFASMFRHFALDPHPAKIMVDTAPAVFAWVARLWNARGASDGPGALEDFASTDWDAILQNIAREFLPYLDANAAAYSAGQRRFDLALGATRYPRMPVVQYRVAVRSQLLRAWASLDDAARASVRIRLQASGASDWLATARDTPSGLDAEFEMPLARSYSSPRGLQALLMRLGTPWDMPAAKGANQNPRPPYS